VPELLVEPAALAVALSTALRRAGLPVPPERSARLAAALRLVPPTSREPLYWTARVTLASGPADLPIFDAVFSALFDGMLDPAETRGDPNAPPAVGSEPHSRPADPAARPVDGSAPGRPSPTSSGNGPPGPDREAVPAVASDLERLAATSFADLPAEDVEAVRRLVRRIVLATPARRTRRTVASSRPGERLDLRRTLRAAQRSGGDPVRLVHRRRRVRPRRLVLLCDVSGSMEAYTRIYLSLLQGAVSGARAEGFVFSTRLTRLTRPLSVRDPDSALALAVKAAPDWAGGTRLAESLRRFVDDHGRRGLARGAVVVVLSDGWAQEEPELVAEQMARLRRLAHRIVWVNPRKAAPGFAPLVGGMAAALPYCDAFVSGHSLAALEEVAAAVAGSPSRSPSASRAAVRPPRRPSPPAVSPPQPPTSSPPRKRNP
jgi:uncharacterized protein with von Willebrand factor type A (vWA) domain